MSTSKSYADGAKMLLRHYLSLSGAPTQGDNGAEIEEIVNHIVDAAVARIVERFDDDVRENLRSDLVDLIIHAAATSAFTPETRAFDQHEDETKWRSENFIDDLLGVKP